MNDKGLERDQAEAASADSMGKREAAEGIPFDLEPLPYHAAVRDFLKSEHTPLWDWFSKTRTRDEHAEAIRFDLLKRTYRIDRESEPIRNRLTDEELDAAFAHELARRLKFGTSTGPSSGRG